MAVTDSLIIDFDTLQESITHLDGYKAALQDIRDGFKEIEVTIVESMGGK